MRKWLIAPYFVLVSGVSSADVVSSGERTIEDVDTGKITQRIEEAYPGKKLVYVSRGFIQFSSGELVRDREVERMAEDLGKKLGLKDKIDGINFSDGECAVIDNGPRHIGDSDKDWFPVKKSGGVVYERKFNLNDVEKLGRSKLGMEVLFADSKNKIFVNGQEVGCVPNLPKSRWGELMKKYEDKLPFHYGEVDVPLKHLKEGENVLRIESERVGRIIKNYDDFMVRRIHLFSEEKREDDGNER